MKQLLLLKKLASRSAANRKEDITIPDDTKLELYPRTTHLAVFDRVDLMIEFSPGKDGVGATFKSFIHAIKVHDEIIKTLEEKMKLVATLRRDLTRKTRLYQSYSSAWSAMFEHMKEFYEYKELKSKMKTFDFDFQFAMERQNEEEMKRLNNQKRRLEHLKVKNVLIEKMQTTIEEAKDSRDEASKLLADEEALCDKLRMSERRAAENISDDHIYADEQRIPFSDMFPNIRVGYILASINDLDVENMPYSDVIMAIRDAKPPHLAAFRRYDNRYDPFNVRWWTLPELREKKIFVDDPLLPQWEFVNAVNSGDTETVKKYIIQGEDPNALDPVGSTGMHYAATNNDFAMMNVLRDAGAKVDIRDKYMVTPYLSAVRKGHLQMAEYLLTVGANPHATDRNGRGALFDAVNNGDERIIRFLVQKSNLNEADSMWGYTPLHLVASQGNIPILQLLLTLGASIYRLANNGKTAEEVAVDAGQKEAHRLLETERLTAPAQLVLSDPFTEINVWIGELVRRWESVWLSKTLSCGPLSPPVPLRATQAAMDADWSSEVGITNIICVHDPDDPEKADALIKAKVKKDGADPTTAIHWLHAENDEDRKIHEGKPVAKASSALVTASAASPSKGNRKENAWAPLHVMCDVEADDDDRTPEAWNNLSKALPTIMPQFLRLLKVREFWPPHFSPPPPSPPAAPLHSPPPHEQQQ